MGGWTLQQLIQVQPAGALVPLISSWLCLCSPRRINLMSLTLHYESCRIRGCDSPLQHAIPVWTIISVRKGRPTVSSAVIWPPANQVLRNQSGTSISSLRQCTGNEEKRIWINVEITQDDYDYYYTNILYGYCWNGPHAVLLLRVLSHCLYCMAEHSENTAQHWN